MTIMAARGPGKSQVQHTGGSCSYESNVEKLTSSTLKRNPKMEFSKTDLLKLLSILEGELEAREVVIAVLKAEQVKQLLYPHKRTGNVADPWSALQRDVFGGYDPAFDEATVKALYGMQLRQLECLILQQKKAQGKLREQLRDARQRYARAVAELEDEKRKHAQDTAQGDDVTYLLEKERERLRQEVEFERQQNRRLEKDLKRVTQTLEQERARQKQIVLLLLTERKQLIMRLLEERHRSEELVQYLDDEKGKFADMVEGLEEESKRSLQMEAEMERQLRDFEMEREQYKVQIMSLETQSQELMLEIEKLRDELDNVRKTYGENVERMPVHLGEGVRSTIVTMASTPGAVRVIPTVSVAVSPPRGMARAVSPKSIVTPTMTSKPPGLGSQKVPSPGTVIIPPKPTLSTMPGAPPVGRLSPATVTSPVNFGSTMTAPSTGAPIPPPKAVKLIKPHGSSPRSVSPSHSENTSIESEQGGDTAKQTSSGTYHNVPYVVTTMDPHTVERPVPLLASSVAGDSTASTTIGSRMPHPGQQKAVSVSTPGKIGHHSQQMSSPVGGPSQVALAARKIQAAGRGTPPPVPPNKPILAPQALQRKDLGVRPPVPPRTELHIDTSHLPTTDLKPQRLPSPGSRGGQAIPKERPADGAQHSSPSQGMTMGSAVPNQVGASSVCQEATLAVSNNPAENSAVKENGNIDMLGQELADFQQLLVSMVQNKH